MFESLSGQIINVLVAIFLCSIFSLLTFFRLRLSGVKINMILCVAVFL